MLLNIFLVLQFVSSNTHLSIWCVCVGGGGGGVCVVRAICICMYVCASFVGIILYTEEAGEGKEGRSQKEEKKEKIPIVGEGYPDGPPTWKCLLLPSI